MGVTVLTTGIMLQHLRAAEHPTRTTQLRVLQIHLERGLELTAWAQIAVGDWVANHDWNAPQRVFSDFVRNSRFVWTAYFYHYCRKRYWSAHRSFLSYAHFRTVVPVYTVHTLLIWNPHAVDGAGTTESFRARLRNALSFVVPMNCFESLLITLSRN